MDEKPEQGGKHMTMAEASKIYFLPNLMTAGNLFCGFMSVIRCIQAKFAANVPIVSEWPAVEKYSSEALYEQAVWYILAAVIFDSLDGRLARLGGKESLFGKEFDSIADVISFGMAPALMVFFLILSPTHDFPLSRDLGLIIGFIYLLCVAVRLARFNVLTSPFLAGLEPAKSDDFIGLPSPAAAGMIASLVLALNRAAMPTITDFLPALLPTLLLLIATLMISGVRYPSFKHIGWKTELKFRKFIYSAVIVILIYKLRIFAIPVLFLIYIFYGLLRHFHWLGKLKTEARNAFEEDDSE